jgi:Ca2+/H+ antiporter
MTTFALQIELYLQTITKEYKQAHPELSPAFVGLFNLVTEELLRYFKLENVVYGGGMLAQQLLYLRNDLLGMKPRKIFVCTKKCTLACLSLFKQHLLMMEQFNTNVSRQTLFVKTFLIINIAEALVNDLIEQRDTVGMCRMIVALLLCIWVACNPETVTFTEDGRVSWDLGIGFTTMYSIWNQWFTIDKLGGWSIDHMIAIWKPYIKTIHNPSAWCEERYQSLSNLFMWSRFIDDSAPLITFKQ